MSHQFFQVYLLYMNIICFDCYKLFHLVISKDKLFTVLFRLMVVVVVVVIMRV